MPSRLNLCPDLRPRPELRTRRLLLVRPLVAAFLVLVTLAGTSGPVGAAGPAREPHRPLPDYRPTFVTETDEAPPFKDCLWAAGAMFLDKWTAGEVQASRQRLRRLSGDRSGGSTFQDLRRAYAKLGLDLEYSPDGGRFIRWPDLLKRLKDGGGAILLGDYGDLPRAYGRWDLAFWRKEGKDDNHALYLDRYDPKRQAVWVMDPLGRGDWDGEWIPVRYLKRYAWRTGGGGLWVAMTPRAEPAPFAGVAIGEATAAASREAVTVDWPLGWPRGAEPDGWRYPGADLHVDVTRLESGLVPASAEVLEAAAAPPAPAPIVDGDSASVAAVGSAPAARPGGSMPEAGRGSAAVRGSAALDALPGVLRATVPLPGEPGVYRIRLRLSERRFGQTVAAAGPYTVFVPGDRQASVAFAVAGKDGRAVDTTVAVDTGAADGDVDTRTVETGASLDLGVYVANTGAASWADPTVEPGTNPGTKPSTNHGTNHGTNPGGRLRFTALWAHWVAADPELDVDAPPPTRLQSIELAPGDERLLWLSVTAPSRPGDWTLVLDPADLVDGSFAASGSRPASIPIRVVQRATLLGLPTP